MKFELFQNQAMRKHGKEVNELGWDKADKKIPAVHAHLKLSGDGSKNWKPEFAKHYKHVAVLHAKDLEDCFRVGNVGHEHEVDRVAPMRSVSIGDIIRNPRSGDCFMVDPEGFGKIELRRSRLA